MSGDLPVWVISTVVAAVVIALFLHRLFEGEALLLDLVDEFHLKRRNLQEVEALYFANPNRSDAIISLTTIPSRIGFLDQTIKSLLRQSLAPREIQLHVPAFSKREQTTYEIPDWLRALESVNVISCDDWGPATKFLPAAIASVPEQKIVVVDDDRIYPVNFLSDLEQAADALPGQVLSFSGWCVPADLTDHSTTVLANLLLRPPAPVRATRISNPYKIDIVQGVSGYLFTPSIMDLKGMQDYSDAPDAAFYVDDVWFSAHSKSNKFVIPSSRLNYPQKLTWGARFKRSSLALVNRGDGTPENRNNTIMIRHFADKWIVRLSSRKLA